MPSQTQINPRALLWRWLHYILPEEASAGLSSCRFALTDTPSHLQSSGHPVWTIHLAYSLELKPSIFSFVLEELIFSINS